MPHILIIDDNPSDRLLVKRELEREFSKVQLTEIADAKALSEGIASDFDLAITDFQLRWSDGLTVVKTIKARYPDRPVIMFTNTGNEEVAVAAMKSGLDDYITKSPQHFVRLALSVRTALDKAAAFRQVTLLENRLQSLLDRLNVGVFRADLTGRLLACNRAFLSLLGLNSLTEAQAQDLKQMFWESAVPSEFSSSAKEIPIALANGEQKWISLTQSLNTTEAEPFIDGLIEDITDRKQAEIAQEQLNATLEERVRERTADLEAFAYSVSHDLRAPLRSIQAFAQILLEDYTSQLDATAQDYLNRIISSAALMNTLIQNLLDYSSLSRANLALGAVNLGSALAEALNQLLVEVDSSNAQIVLVEPFPLVLAHPTTLIQVLTNLLSNGIKFVSPGVQPQVRVWAETQETKVRLWIEDRGIGIRSQDQGRIFNVFERLHGVETYPGTGIGLAIARRGVERMGGAIGVESLLGQGSRFFLDLLPFHFQSPT